MPKYYISTRSCGLGSHTPGGAQGVTLEEPTAGNLHAGVRAGRELTGLCLTYPRTKLATADRAKEDLKSRRFSSTRKGDLSPIIAYEDVIEFLPCAFRAASTAQEDWMLQWSADDSARRHGCGSFLCDAVLW